MTMAWLGWLFAVVSAWFSPELADWFSQWLPSG